MTHHWSQIIENQTFKDKGLSLSGKSDVLIRNCDFSYDKSDTTMLTLSNCKGFRVENCKFHSKRTKGLGLKIAGTGSGEVVGCEFYDLTFSDANGGEPVRIGNSHSSGVTFKVTFRDNYFHNLAADPETISIKCVGATVEYNTFENNKSNVTVRHGGFATIRNNLFKGSGGIRVYGYGNVIENNHFQDNKDSKYVPLTLGAGTVAKDPNFTAPDKPSGKEGTSHAEYAQINHNTIRNNTFKNCSKTVVQRTDKSLKPINSTIEPLKEGDATQPVGKGGGASSTPPTPEPTPTEPPAPVPTTPPEEEEEAPKPLCTICKEEEATLKLSVLVGPKHYAAMKKKLIEGIKALKAEAKEGDREEQ